MGEWRVPESPQWIIGDLLAGLIDDRKLIMDISIVLTRSHRIPTNRYYVPDESELHKVMYALMDRRQATSREWRWVMCRETIEALNREYYNHKLARPPFWTFGPNGPEGTYVDPTMTDMPAIQVIREAAIDVLTGKPEQGVPGLTQISLFGLPVRIDPAARKPMIEWLEKER